MSMAIAPFWLSIDDILAYLAQSWQDTGVQHSGALSSSHSQPDSGEGTHSGPAWGATGERTGAETPCNTAGREHRG